MRQLHADPLDRIDPNGRRFNAACDRLLDSLHVPPVVNKDFTPLVADAFEAANGEEEYVREWDGGE